MVRLCIHDLLLSSWDTLMRARYLNYISMLYSHLTRDSRIETRLDCRLDLVEIHWWGLYFNSIFTSDWDTLNWVCISILYSNQIEIHWWGLYLNSIFISDWDTLMRSVSQFYIHIRLRYTELGLRPTSTCSTTEEIDYRFYRSSWDGPW
jgi:hypothetical protein